MNESLCEYELRNEQCLEELKRRKLAAQREVSKLDRAIYLMEELQVTPQEVT